MGCGDGLSNFRDTTLKRAAFEMQCSEDKLQLAELGGPHVGVTGCGKQAVYVYVNEGGGVGKWVNNTGVEKK
jgi:hypothetical protein